MNKNLKKEDQPSVKDAITNIETKKKEIAGVDLDDILNTVPKASSANLAQWVGTVTLVEENIPYLKSFKSSVTQRRFQLAIIDSLIEAIKAGNGSHVFKSTVDVDHFDSNQVFNTYTTKYTTSTHNNNPSNTRMGHLWGGQLLGNVAWNGKQAAKWLAANDLPDTVAFFKVTKQLTNQLANTKPAQRGLFYV